MEDEGREREREAEVSGGGATWNKVCRLTHAYGPCYIVLAAAIEEQKEREREREEAKEPKRGEIRQ